MTIATGREIATLKRAVVLRKRLVVRIDGKPAAIVPLRDLRRLERLLEQEKEREKELDRLDVEEAERRLDDPTEIPIPYEQARRELGLVDPPGRLAGGSRSRFQ